MHPEATGELARHGTGGHEIAFSVAAELVRQRRVVELGHHAGVDPLCVEPGAQLVPHHRVFTWHQHGRAVQAIWKGPNLSGQQGRRGKKAHWLVTHRVALGAHPGRARQRRIGDDQVELMQGELRQQAVEPPLAADQVHVLAHAQHRRQQLEGHRFGHGVGHPHAELDALLRLGLVARTGLQLGAQREDLAGIALHHAPFVGERQAPAMAVEQTAAQLVFELLQLLADGLRTDVQLFAGARDAAGVGHLQEVAQVLEVQVCHSQSQPKI